MKNIKNNLTLIVLLMILMLLIAVMFIYLYSENIKLKQQVSDLRASQPAEDPYTVVLPPQTEPLSEKQTEPEPYIIYDNGTDRFDFPMLQRPVSRLLPSETKTVTNEGNRRVITDESGKALTRFGIDVSQHQQVIDWDKVSQSVDFAYIRAGYRGYETGRIMNDSYFADNFRGAEAAGVDTGVYFFSQAVSAEEAEEEAEYMLGILSDGGYEPDLPIAFWWDQHPSPGEAARTDDTDGSTQTECAKAFSDRIKSAGYDCVVYTTVNGAFFRYDLDGFDSGLWIADYGDECTFAYEYRFLQYSQSGIIDGIEDFVDLDVMLIDED